MRIKPLGTSPEEISRRFSLSSYLVNDELAIDAGPLGIGLSAEDQNRVHSIILTHTHIDHIATLPLFLENGMGKRETAPTLYATPHNIAMLRKHLFNNVLWPDMTRISRNYLNMVEVEPYEEISVGELSFHLFPVNHPIPTYGIMLRERKRNVDVLFSSDTSICDVIWIEANKSRRLKALFIETSFPNAYNELALSSGHLTPSLLAGELTKLRRKIPIYLTHYKRQFIDEIEREVRQISDHRITICQVGETITID